MSAYDKLPFADWRHHNPLIYQYLILTLVQSVALRRQITLLLDQVHLPEFYKLLFIIYIFLSGMNIGL